MKLVTFGIYDNWDLVIQFPVFVQPYSQSPLTVLKLYIALNDVIYISLRH